MGIEQEKTARISKRSGNKLEKAINGGQKNEQKETK